MWKIFGWMLAAIGAVVVVRKAAPWVARQIREHDESRRLKSLHQAPAMAQLPAGPQRGTGPKLLDCGAGGSPASVGSPTPGLQSSALFRWCYVVRAGDTAGSIAEAITGDSSRYVEFLTANPGVAKRGKMGIVIGSDAWDFAEGALAEGTKILVSQTMNAWVDQTGVSKGGYVPYAADPRAIHEVASATAPSTDYSSGGFPPPPDMSEAAITTASGSAGWTDGFDYLGGV